MSNFANLQEEEQQQKEEEEKEEVCKSVNDGGRKSQMNKLSGFARSAQ